MIKEIKVILKRASRDKENTAKVAACHLQIIKTITSQKY